MTALIGDVIIRISHGFNLGSLALFFVSMSAMFELV